jgi:subtilisin family serine protease
MASQAFAHRNARRLWAHPTTWHEEPDMRAINPDRNAGDRGTLRLVVQMTHPESAELERLVGDGKRMTRVFHDPAEGQSRMSLAKIVQRARSRDPDLVLSESTLSSFFYVAYTEDEEKWLLENLARSPEVATVYAAGAVGSPFVNLQLQVEQLPQQHLAPAPVGVDAEHAWRHPGGRGEGVRFVDLEVGWDLDFGSLVESSITLVAGHLDKGFADHGTAMLSIVAGVDYPQQLFGVARSIASARVASVLDAHQLTDIPGTIIRVITELRFGDVLLIEEDVSGAAVEIEPAIAVAIRLATARGIVVIEPAGNSGGDLGNIPSPDIKHSGLRPLDRPASGGDDSGAIVVGGAEAFAQDDCTHRRAQFSNYGDRIDCYAWGVSVVTSGYGVPLADLEALPPGTSKLDLAGELYRFGTVLPGAGYVSIAGTSAAAAIIAGVAAVLESLVQVQVGFRLSPWQMRLLLADPANGTRAAPGVDNRIGSMPNLKAIIETVLLPTADLVAKQLALTAQAPEQVIHAAVTDSSSDAAYLKLVFDSRAMPAAQMMRFEVIAGLPRSAQVWLEMPPEVADLAAIWGDPPVEKADGHLYARVNPLGKSYFRERRFGAETSYQLRLVVFVPEEERGREFQVAVLQLRVGWADDAEVWRRTWKIVPLGSRPADVQHGRHVPDQGASV